MVLCSKCNKLISGTGALYYYYQHQSQSVNFYTKERFLSGLESRLRSNIIAREYALRNDLYKNFNYLDFDIMWLKYTHLDFFKLAKKHKCEKEYNEMLHKYNIPKINKILKYTKKYLSK